MLSVEVTPKGGVEIEGSEGDLLDLAIWLLLALRDGSGTATFVADRGLTALSIVRVE